MNSDAELSSRQFRTGECQVQYIESSFENEILSMRRYKMENLNFEINAIYDKIIDPPHDAMNIIRDGYAFTTLKNDNIFDALIVSDGKEANTFYAFDHQMTRTLDECIDLINTFHLGSAVFLTGDDTVLRRCPSIK